MEHCRLGRDARLVTVCVAVAGCAAFLCCGALHAAQVPVRMYGTRDGLPGERANAIYQDLKGYLWFGTWEGLSRFDGARFISYGARDGLPVSLINDITEDPAGRIWVATHGGGIARFDDLAASAARGAEGTPGPKRFEAFSLGAGQPGDTVATILFDAAGRCWCVTEAGLVEGRAGAGGGFSFALALARPRWSAIGLGRGEGALWFLDDTQTVEVRDGVVRAKTFPFHRWGSPTASCKRDDGTFVIAFASALFATDERGLPRGPGGWKRIPISLDPAQKIRTVAAGRDGGLWIGTSSGVLQLHDGWTRRIPIETEKGSLVRAMLADRVGNLWIAEHPAGVFRLAPSGILNFTTADGLPVPNALHLAEGRDGTIYATLEQGGIVAVRGERIERVPLSTKPSFRDLNIRLTGDRAGSFWLGTDDGPCRVAGPALDLSRAACLELRSSGERVGVFGALREDSAGSIWFGGSDGSLQRIVHGTAERMRDGAGDLASPMRELCPDPAGGLWLASFVRLARLRDGSARVMSVGDAGTDINPRELLIDSRGWLWIATRFHGAYVTKDRASEAPRFESYSTANGLLSDAVWSVAEDRFGMIWLATGRGLARIDPSSGSVAHVGAEEGLAADLVNHCIVDHAGRVWAATADGISRVEASAPGTVAPPPVTYVTGVEVDGEALPVPETGVVTPDLPSLRRGSRTVRIGFCAPDFNAGGGPRYQWRMEPGPAGWSEPIDQTSVELGRLGPGTYRFVVRAIGRDGATSLFPASAVLKIPPPIWLTSWFLAISGTAVVAAATLVWDTRRRRRLALDRIRRQIALDLHDDVGSGLSQIAILSEVTRRGAAPATERSLGEVARLARDMRESMSDIVWAIDPAKDRLSDLVHRMREVAFNSSGATRVDFRAPSDAELQTIDVPPDRKRHLFLAFKEALANATRHAGAANITADVAVSGAHLVVSVVDDGSGFDRATITPGRGLASLRRRAEALDADLTVDSAPGRGTVVRLTIPLRRPGAPRMSVRLPRAIFRRRVRPGRGSTQDEA